MAFSSLAVNIILEMKNFIFIAIAISIILVGCKGSEKGVCDDNLLSKNTMRYVADYAVYMISKAATETMYESEPIEDDPKPLTQYYLIDVDNEIGPIFRDNGKLLKKLGFTVRTFERSDDMDECEDFTDLLATRQGRGGVTKIEMTSGMDRDCYIEFANESELAAFVESMRASGYSKSGHIYSHPKNVPGMGQIYAKIEGLTVKMTSPFEMLGTDF
ncbi:MAG: hypothetical protein K2M31_10350 [Muribaculaceae bacterium]|nr:hypothetical protein [Muribaculaceae bacterium]